MAHSGCIIFLYFTCKQGDRGNENAKWVLISFSHARFLKGQYVRPKNTIKFQYILSYFATLFWVIVNQDSTLSMKIR